jgi:putative acetyltransferase
MGFEIREIQPADNRRIAEIIRQVLTEYGANRPGFAWADPELEELATAYHNEQSAYYVVTVQGVVVGGAGIAPFPCETPQLCELQKMYLLPDQRGQGIGRALMATALHAAQSKHYRGCYLETLGGMTEAIALYEKSGFQQLTYPLGNSGHTGCNRFYLMQFSSPTIETA